MIAGCKFYAGYPITPQNEITSYLARRMPDEGGVFIQAESELAAVNMVLGAAAVGMRAFTSSSSPGISLMQETISYLAAQELPCVIINVMRGGPGLGNISSSGGDYFQATRGGGHGDYYTITLAPSGVQEAAELTLLAFDLADYYRNPVIILADAIVGQMMEGITLPEKSSFKKTLPPKVWALGRGDGKSRIIRSLLLKEGALYEHNRQLDKKWKKIENQEQRSKSYKLADASYAIVAYGSLARLCKEVVEVLRKEGIKIGLFRPITLWPYPHKALRRYVKNLKKVFVIEQSLGQMLFDVRLSLGERVSIYFLGKAASFFSLGEIVSFIKKKICQ